LLLISTLLASARFCSCCSGDAANTERHNDNRSDRSHDDLLLGTSSLTCRLAVGSELVQIGPAAAFNSNATAASVAIIAAVTDFFVIIFIVGTAPMMMTNATPKALTRLLAFSASGFGGGPPNGRPAAADT
jgi:hypothetical protein